MRKRISEQDSLEEHMKKMEADRLFAEMKQQETKKIREENEKLKQFLIAQMVIEKQIMFYIHSSLRFLLSLSKTIFVSNTGCKAKQASACDDRRAQVC